MTEEEARAHRNDLLRYTDWTQLGDAQVDKQKWAEYRQSLRDIPVQSGFPGSIEWPEMPINN
jgi:hypothetical protein